MMSNCNFWYVFSVRTGSELKIINQLKQESRFENFIPFILKKTSIYRRKGKKTEFEQNCFPGYIFIESSKCADEFRRFLFPVVYRIKDVFKLLHYGEDRSDIVLRHEEREMLSNIFGVNYSIGISKIYKKGDMVKIVSGSLIGYEGIIKRINSQGKIAVIEVTMFNMPIEINVGIEFISII